MSEPRKLTYQYLADYPQEAAQVLESLPPEDTAGLLETAPALTAAEVMDRMLPWYLADCLGAMDPGLAGERLASLSSSRAVRVLKLSPPALRGNLLRQMPPSRRRYIERQMDYPHNTVGAWMDAFAPTLPSHANVEEALNYARRLRRQWSHHLCLINRDGGFIGVVGLASLISAPNQTPVAELVDPRIQPLPVQATLASIRFHPSWNHAQGLPVVDAQSRMEGWLQIEHLREGLGEGFQGHEALGGWAACLVPLFVGAATVWTRSMMSLPYVEPENKETGDAG